MFIYKVTFTSGISIKIRAGSPNDAHTIASKISEVTHIKFMR